MPPYVPRKCPICGSSLDPGETCDCMEPPTDNAQASGPGASVDSAAEAE